MLPQTKRAAIDSLEPAERLAAIGEELSQQEQQRFFEEVQQSLTDEDLRGVFRFVTEVFRRHEDELLALLPEDQRQLPDHPDRWKHLMFRVARHKSMVEVGNMLTITDVDLADLKRGLSQRAQRHFRQVDTGGEHAPGVSMDGRDANTSALQLWAPHRPRDARTLLSVAAAQHQVAPGWIGRRGAGAAN